MDISKLKYLSRLANNHDQITCAIKEFKTEYDKSALGCTSITIPRSWLPAIVKIAEEELVKVEEEIAKL